MALSEGRDVRQRKCGQIALWHARREGRPLDLNPGCVAYPKGALTRSPSPTASAWIMPTAFKSAPYHITTRRSRPRS